MPPGTEDTAKTIRLGNPAQFSLKRVPSLTHTSESARHIGASSGQLLGTSNGKLIVSREQIVLAKSRLHSLPGILDHAQHRPGSAAEQRRLEYAIERGKTTMGKKPPPPREPPSLDSMLRSLRTRAGWARKRGNSVQVMHLEDAVRELTHMAGLQRARPASPHSKLQSLKMELGRKGAERATSDEHGQKRRRLQSEIQRTEEEMRQRTVTVKEHLLEAARTGQHGGKDVEERKTSAQAPQMNESHQPPGVMHPSPDMVLQHVFSHGHAESPGPQAPWPPEANHYAFHEKVYSLRDRLEPFPELPAFPADELPSNLPSPPETPRQQQLKQPQLTQYTSGHDTAEHHPSTEMSSIDHLSGLHHQEEPPEHRYYHWGS